MFQMKVVGKTKHTFMFNNFFFLNRTMYEIMWKNIVEPEGPQMIIWRMLIVCRIPKITNTHSEDIILIACLGYFHSLQMNAGTCAGP
jgi:hypothetical protein